MEVEGGLYQEAICLPGPCKTTRYQPLHGNKFDSEFTRVIMEDGYAQIISLNINDQGAVTYIGKHESSRLDDEDPE